VKAFSSVLVRELRLAARDGGALGTALGFYLIVVALMPLAVGPDLKLLSRIAAGVLWVALLLSALLSLGRLFESDFEDGSLDVMVVGGLPLELVVVAKSFAHWLTTGVPMALIAPVLGLLLNFDIGAMPFLVGTMLSGTLAISFLGAICAALTLKARKGGILIAVMVLPLYVPTLIYGISAVSIAITPPGSPWPSFLLLSAISLGSVVIGPVAAAAALRYQVQ
jgi:heme exporter protein B